MINCLTNGLIPACAHRSGVYFRLFWRWSCENADSEVIFPACCVSNAGVRRFFAFAIVLQALQYVSDCDDSFYLFHCFLLVAVRNSNSVTELIKTHSHPPLAVACTWQKQCTRQGGWLIRETCSKLVIYHTSKYCSNYTTLAFAFIRFSCEAY